MRNGFSLIELMIAFAFSTTAIVAISLAAYGTPAILQNAFTESDASAGAHSLLEHAALFARGNANALTGVATTSTNSISLSLSLQPINDVAEHVSSLTSWISNERVPQSLSYDALITDYRHPTDYPCDPFVSGDWQHPRLLATYQVAPGVLLPATVPSGQYPVSSVAIQGTVLGVGVANTAHITDPTIVFFRVGDPTQPPVYINSFDNTPESTVGITALAAGNNFIYAANGFGAVSSSTSCSFSTLTCRQLLSYQTNGTVPLQALTMQIPTTSPSLAITTTGAVAPGNAIAYRTGAVYLGLAKTNGGQEFQIIDVSNPNTYKRIGGASAGRGVNAIAVDRTSAYVGTDDNSTGGKAIITEDIRASSTPTELASYSFPGAGFVRALARVNGYLYSGRSYVTGTSEEFSLLSLGALPLRVGGADIGTSQAHRGVKAIIVRDFIAFVLVDDQLQMWNVSDAQHPTLYSNLSLPSGTATSMTCRLNALYIGSTDADGNGYVSVVTSS